MGIIIGAAAGGAAVLIAGISAVVYFLSGNNSDSSKAGAGKVGFKASADERMFYLNQYGGLALRLDVDPPVYRLY